MDATRRFATRVENYIKYRPSYPPGLVSLLEQRCGLGPSSVVADVGSGTGILAELLLAKGCEVFGVEPNAEMREAGERLLAKYPRFHSVAGAAEATTLPSHSVDLVTAGQAFHWFDRTRARPEISRVLRCGGWVALVWNDRRLTSTPFLEAYESLLRTYGTDYAAVASSECTLEVVEAFFSPAKVELVVLDNRQEFDFEGLKGRLLSSSYTPEEGDPRYQPMLAELARIFAAHAASGKVAFEYDTKAYLGHL